MRILHLSDFHYTNGTKALAEQKNRVDALINCLVNDVKNIDLILFTGDLVQSGDNINNFEEAKNLLLDRIARELNIDVNKVFICPGNHESHFGQEIDIVKESIDNIKDCGALDSFVNDKPKLELSLKNFEIYNQFKSDFYLEHSIFKENSDLIKELYTIHKRTIDNKNIGIVTINSAWRSFNSAIDKGRLVYPISFIQNIVQETKDCDIKIFMLHHCLSDFKEFIQTELEDLVYSNFHLLFSGHYHKQRSSTHIIGEEGIFCDVSPAALSYYDKHSKIGFSVLDFDAYTFDVKVEIYSFESSINTFALSDTFESEVPFNHSKRAQNNLRKTIRKKYKEAEEEADNLFLATNEHENGKTFINLFTNPILALKPKHLLNIKASKIETFSQDSLLDDNNYLIYGKDKSGKTSILWNLKLNILRNYSQYQLLPLLIDCNVYHKSGDKIDIVNELHKFFEVNKAKALELTQKFRLVLLLDNFDTSYENVNNQIKNFVSSNNVKVIACAIEKIVGSYENVDFITEKFNKLFIHEISKTEIRQLTKKWETIPEKKHEYLIEKIIQISTQFNMPTNYWTVSLFLWIFEKTDDAKLNNNFELIQLYIDGLLERQSIAHGKSLNLDYDDFKSYLGSLAYFLLQNSVTNYSASYSQIVSFTEEYRKKNRKIIAKVEDIVEFIIKKGIVKQTSTDNYSFRLNGIFEYFLAVHMNENEKFRTEALMDNYYLSFSNEFELYSGFNKKEKSFINQIFSKTKEIFKDIISNPDFRDIDKRLLLSLGEVFNIQYTAMQIAESSKSLSPSEQDEYLGEILPPSSIEQEVRLKHYYETIECNTDNLERALFILCRVFRNTNIDDEKTQDDIFNFILDAVCNVGLLILKESEQSQEIIYVSNDDKIEVVQKLIANFLPVMIEVFLFDALMQNNLERIVQLKIEELKKVKEKNQFKLFILYYLIIDLDPKKNKDYIEEIIEISQMGIIKNSNLIKLCSYLMFKAYSDKSFEAFLREKIKFQNIKIDSKVNKGAIESELEKTSKLMRLRKNN